MTYLDELTLECGVVGASRSARGGQIAGPVAGGRNPWAYATGPVVPSLPTYVRHGARKELE